LSNTFHDVRELRTPRLDSTHDYLNHTPQHLTTTRTMLRSRQMGLRSFTICCTEQHLTVIISETQGEPTNYSHTALAAIKNTARVAVQQLVIERKCPMIPPF